ncbi:hypothetical protein JKP88DRAFT_285030 [Tribonema minus]|uniref:Uncharacterized protein n=1 Tax=Tribonema minus TaxID=303371 RepID=A0A836CNC6_9STRA|nr:hypothetical protein JKP88DRAFT_285030 [Tribonema minus]
MRREGEGRSAPVDMRRWVMALDLQRFCGFMFRDTHGAWVEGGPKKPKCDPLLLVLLAFDVVTAHPQADGLGFAILLNGSIELLNAHFVRGAQHFLQLSTPRYRGTVACGRHLEGGNRRRAGQGRLVAVSKLVQDNDGAVPGRALLMAVLSGGTQAVPAARDGAAVAGRGELQEVLCAAHVACVEQLDASVEEYGEAQAVGLRVRRDAAERQQHQQQRKRCKFNAITHLHMSTGHSATSPSRRIRS